MCFSATASFTAGTGLTALGIYILHSNKQQKLHYFKAIPVLFGIQQLCEGFVWITQSNLDYLLYNPVARYGYLFFAYFLWPLYIPFALYQIETNEKKKRCLASLFGIGAVIATTLGYLSLSLGATSAISCSHIVYAIPLPRALNFPLLFWYCIATIGPFFVVKKKHMHLFGLLLIGSVLVSLSFYSFWFTSVWCFFAALLSVMVYKIK